MIDQVINSETRPAWTLVGTVDGGAVAAEPVAVHDDGAALFVDETAPADPASYIASLVLPLSATGVVADVVVATESFHEQRELLGFVRELCDSYTGGALDLDAIAIIPHEGSVGTVDLEVVKTGDAESIANSKLADVFCIDTSDVPDAIDIEDIKSNYPALVNYVYGLNTEVDESDIVDSITSAGEAYDDISLDVYTVTNEEMSLLSSDGDTSEHPTSQYE